MNHLVDRRRRFFPRLAVLVLTLAGVLAAAAPALAVVTVSRAELAGTRLRIEGTAAPNRPITVDGVTMGTSDAAGAFRIENGSFAAPASCRVAVDDGSAAPVTATLSGCSAAAPPPPPPPATAPALSKITISPTDVIGGASATGTATLTASAPAGGVQVTLSSDNIAAATVPPSVIVPGGSASATFTVSTNVVGNPQSALIIGTAGGVTTYGIITAWTPFLFANGSVSVLPGGGGSGRVTSQPVGIDCTITLGNGSGACSVFFPVGTVVRLDARPAANSSFVGFRPVPGCIDASKITVSRGALITCQVGFVLG